MKKQSGMSLIEVMVAAGALGGLALVALNMTKTMNYSVKKNSLDSEITLMLNEINSHLADPTLCVGSLSGKNALTTTSGLTQVGKFKSLEAGSFQYGNEHLSIQKYTLASTTAGIAAKSADLVIEFKSKQVVSTTNPIKKINLYVEVDGSNLITNCRSISKFTQEIWSRGSGSNIFYSGGRVGIGTSAPVSFVDIQNPAGNSTIFNTGYAGGFAGVYNRSIRGTQTAPSATQNGDALGTFGFRGYGATAFTTISSSYMRGFATENWTDTAWGANLVFFTTPNASNVSAERARLDHNGNLGIGTSDPKSLLHLSGTNTSTWIRVVNTDSSVGRWPGMYIQNFMGSVSGGGPAIGMHGSRGTEASPAAVQAADYLGTIAGQGQYSSTPGQLWQTAGITFRAASNFSATNGETEMLFMTTGPSETANQTRMILKGDGKVGIGTGTPQRTLHVSFNNSASDGTNGRLVVENTASGSGASVGLQFRTAASDAAQGIQFATNSGNWMSFHTMGFSNNAAYGGYFFQFDNGAFVPMVIKYPTGYVGIGTTSPSYNLHVNGSVAGSSAYNNLSDIRFKKDVEKIPNALEKILMLDGVFYRFKTAEFPDKKFSDRREMGVIAQNVEQVFPEVVSKDLKGFRSVAYSMLIAPIIEAIKELHKDASTSSADLALLHLEMKKMQSDLNREKIKNFELGKRISELEKKNWPEHNQVDLNLIQ